MQAFLLAAVPSLKVDVWHGFDAARHGAFVDRYWQKRPLLIRGLLAPDALPGCCPLTPASLFDLACDLDQPSRLVRESGGVRPWEVRRGPFSPNEFAPLHSAIAPRARRWRAAPLASRAPGPAEYEMEQL